ncbi:unnamed protein product, partial [Meganyctiphanes norvegica]
MTKNDDSDYILHISQSISSKTILAYTVEHEVENGLDIRKLEFKKEFEDCVNCIRRVSLGNQNVKSSRSILLVGATGAGKSSLVSSLVNKAFGIRYEDNYRIKIVEKESQNKSSAESQTEWITVYQFNHMPGMSIDYNLTIIDTPGLNDTRGLAFDKLMFERLEMVLKIDRFGVDELHCIGIVTQASATRLTDSQKYVYDGCMRMFGNNVKEIIHIMATYSDQSEPKIIDGLNKVGVEYVQLHQFNNSSMYLNNKSDNKRHAKMNELNWEYMDETCGDFLNFLSTADGQSLTQTAETLENRRVLHNKIKKVEKKFLTDLKKAQNLQQVRSSANGNQNKALKLTDIAPRKVPCTTKVLNCTSCNVTCHNPCYGKDKCKLCKELSKEGKCCRVCGCLHYSHFTDTFHYINVLVETSYKEASEQERMENMRELIKSLVELRNCVDTLKTVALRPVPISIEDYVESLIETENEKNDESTK